MRRRYEKKTTIAFTSAVKSSEAGRFQGQPGRHLRSSVEVTYAGELS